MVIWTTFRERGRYLDRDLLCTPGRTSETFAAFGRAKSSTKLRCPSLPMMVQRSSGRACSWTFDVDAQGRPFRAGSVGCCDWRRTHTLVPLLLLSQEGFCEGSTRRFLPLRFEWFDDGLYIDGSARSLAHMLGQRVTGLGGYRGKFLAAFRSQRAGGIRIFELRLDDRKMAEAKFFDLMSGASGKGPSTIDVRETIGGDGTLIPPFLAALERRLGPDWARKVTVLQGRRTHSAGIMLLSALRQRGVRSFGQPTGDAPSHYGETEVLRLPAFDSGSFMRAGSTKQTTPAIVVRQSNRTGPFPSFSATLPPDMIPSSRVPSLPMGMRREECFSCPPAHDRMHGHPR